MRLAMARGKHRRGAPVALMAAAFTLLATGGIVAVTGTADAESGANKSADSAAGCRPDQVIPLDDLLGGSARGDRSGCTDDGSARAALNSDKDPRGDSDGKRNDRKERDKKKDNKKNDKKNDKKNADVEFPGRDKAGGPARKDFVSIEDVRSNVKQVEVKRNGSTGTFTSPCGTNAEGHRNSDNFMVAPGKRNGAQHVHDYVGNLSANAFSTDESLHEAATTCANGDRSTYFWPVLRNTDAKGPDALVDGGGLDGNFGKILQPASAQLQFRGNPTSQVTPMPDDLTLITGDAKAATNGGDNANAAWTCTGFEDRTTTKYPQCPQGSRLVRILDFPSCWDGNNLDSEDHRAHVVFPRQDGSCKRGTVAIPQLRMTLTYDQPGGRNFALDSFPEQRHKAITDHGDFMAIMPEALLKQMADCINSGQTC
ncbi:MAG: DUF1996 domain-containing protein [Actinomycetota bacterium]|nr:DUF1996 domain-containing protein [Actinomycetota bacterium]